MDNLIGNRLGEFIKAKSLKQLHVAKMTGIAQGTLSNYENNKRLPSTEFLCQLIKLYRLNINWLLTGEGDMFIANASHKSLNKTELHENISNDIIANKIRMLNELGQLLDKQIINIVEFNTLKQELLKHRNNSQQHSC